MLENGLEPAHLLLVLAVILLVFGGKKLPEVARGLGQGLRIFRAEMRADDDPDEERTSPSSDVTERPR